MSNIVEGQFDTSKVNSLVKYGLTILLIIALIDSFLSGSYVFGIVSVALSWFYSGPQCVKWAQQYGHNQTWAFFIGIVFNLFGVLAYWLFIKRLHIPIIGGFVAVLLLVIFLIVITLIRLPVIYPTIDSYSKNSGVVGAFALFIVVFIIGCVIGYYYKQRT